MEQSGLVPNVQVGTQDTTTDAGKLFEKPASAGASPLRTQDPNRIEWTTDKLGRKIGVRKPTAIDRFEMTCLLGQSANIEAVVQQASLVAAIVNLNGEKWVRPVSLLELKSRLTRLDFEGIEAAVGALGKFAPDSAEDEGVAEAADAAVKNS